jgi:hypothetical protein
MKMKIPSDELNRTEAKCNALFALEGHYEDVVRSLEEQYGTTVRHRIVRSIAGGGAGAPRVVLEELSHGDSHMRDLH